jgi:hypothetical protein
LLADAFGFKTKVTTDFSGVFNVATGHNRQGVRTNRVARQNISRNSTRSTRVVGIKAEHAGIGSICIRISVLLVWYWGDCDGAHNKSIQWAFILSPYRGIVPYFWEEYLDYYLDVFNLWMDLR